MLALLSYHAYVNGQAAVGAFDAFEAASVKPTPARAIVMSSMQGGPGSSDPGRITYTGVNLRNLVATAYGVGYNAVLGPAWLDDVRCDIVATIPRGTTHEQFRLMLLHLLEERFKLISHREAKQATGYALVVAKGGPKLKLADETLRVADNTEAGRLSPNSPQELDEDGFPVTPVGPGVREVCILGGCRFRATSATMQELAHKLPCRCPPIVDETQLTGRYAFILTCDLQKLVMPQNQNDEISKVHGRWFPDVFQALQTQLGLKLERRKVLATLVQVDHMEKTPIEN